MSNWVLKTSLAGPRSHSNPGAARTRAHSAATNEGSLVCLGKKLSPLVVLGSDLQFPISKPTTLHTAKQRLSATLLIVLCFKPGTHPVGFTNPKVLQLRVCKWKSVATVRGLGWQSQEQSTSELPHQKSSMQTSKKMPTR